MSDETLPTVLNSNLTDDSKNILTVDTDEAAIAIGPSGDPDDSAVLDVVSTTKGFLPPRMTTAQKAAISTPATGLVVYDTDIDALFLYNGTAWQRLSAVNGSVVTVSQATDINTAVTASGPTTFITTQSASTAALSVDTFTVTNTSVTTTSAVVAKIDDYAGTILTNGVPIVLVDAVAAGSFDLTIYNAHATNALSGVLKIGVIVHN